MSKEKQEKRFVQVFSEDCGFFGPESSLVADRETGVTYPIIRNAFGSGCCKMRLLNSVACKRVFFRSFVFFFGCKFYRHFNANQYKRCFCNRREVLWKNFYQY